MEGNGFAEGYAIGADRNNNCCNNGYNGFGWGGDWAWLIILFALFGGWGNNGFGGGFGGNGNLNYELGKVATSNDVAVGFAQNATLSSLNDLKLGQAGIQQTLCQGFSGVNTAIAQNGYETRLAVNDLGYRMQQCCCDLGSQIQNVNYNIATQGCAIQNSINNSTRDIIDSQRDGTNAILNFLTQEKISSLQAENAQLTAQLSQNAQTRTLIDTLRPCPQPAYITCSPYESVYGTGYWRNGYNNGCGCGGCGCGC